MDLSLIFFFLFVLVVIQSIAGIGILVIGTPLLLIFNQDFVVILSILLPLSVTTSFSNLVYFNYKYKNKIKIDNEIKNYFFFICIPAIFLGLLLLKEFKNIINFKYLVSFIIFTSILFSNFKNKNKFINLNSEKIILFVVGIIHGVSNCGGSLLSLFLSNKSKMKFSRYSITFFYLFLAMFQLIMFIILFDYNFSIKPDLIIYALSITLLGIFFGNYITKFINEKIFKQTINVICIYTCIFLIIS